MKGLQIGKEEIKLLLPANDMLAYIENPKESVSTIITHSPETSDCNRKQGI